MINALLYQILSSDNECNISALARNDKFEFLDWTSSVSGFKVTLSKPSNTLNMTDNPPKRIYVNKPDNNGCAKKSP